MTKHNYEKEIFDILVSEGGEILGFNKLMRKGSGSGFNPTVLRQYLDKMESDRKILIEDIGNKQKFVLCDFDFKKALKKFTKDLDRIETKLFRPKLSDEDKLLVTREYLLIAFQKYNQLLTAWLNAECVESNKGQAKIIERSEKHIRNSMMHVLKKLREHERLQIINSLPYL